jgi:dephospho-CoA kinase
MILGITGGTGGGKTTLLQVAQSCGFQVLDCDRIYHELLETEPSLTAAIEERFPGTVKDGQLQRKKLGAVVFADPQALADLNTITHSAVRRVVEARLQENTAIDAFALFESGMNSLCDVTVAVTAPEELRIQRLMAREGITEEYAKSRIAAQHSDNYYRQRCDYVLENDGDIMQFQGKCLAFFHRLGIMEENPKEV